jgi:nucleotide-binding universal stress UspA family protein
MFKNLLVPLDGSRMAESVLPATVYLSDCLQAKVSLVHVIEKDAPTEIHGEPHLRTIDEAGNYLKTISQRSFPTSTSVEYHVHESEVKNVAKSIYEHIGELDSDLVVMCSHGSGGFRNLMFGNIAQQVIALGITPVLVIHPTKVDSNAKFSLQRLLVPLDGNPEHEQGIPVAKELAQACRASVHLLEVVPTFSTVSEKWSATRKLLPHTTAEVLDMSVSKAGEYLQHHQSDLQNAGIDVTIEVSRGDPAQIICESAEKMNMDLTIIGTHGKKGTHAFWSGSVAPKVCQTCRKPLLLVPVLFH